MKKGFTLIEIIISISLVALIGTGSLFGIKLVNKNIRISKLEQITDKALKAAEIYVQTNEKTYNELYKKQNGVVIPLNVLVEEGLLDLSATTLEDKDIENEYVVTALGGETEEDNCVDIRTTTSWNENMNQPIYICTDKNGNSNLATLSSSEIGNLNNSKKERFYFRGSNPLNYIQLKGDASKTYRILYVDKDDTLTIVKDSSFGSTFNGLTINQTCFSTNYIMATCSLNNDKLFYEPKTGTVTEGECRTGGVDAAQISVCNYTHDYITKDVYERAYAVQTTGYTPYGWLANFANQEKNRIGQLSSKNYYKIRLKDCMKITSGTGDLATPYILENKC